MQVIKINCGHKLNDDELKMIGFASEDIQGYYIEENNLIVEIKEIKDINDVAQKIKKLVKNKNLKNNIVYSNCPFVRYTNDKALINSTILRKYHNAIILENDGIELYEYFDNKILEMLDKNNFIAKKCKYPTLLSLETLNKAAYLYTSPQYINLCTTFSEDIEIYKKIGSCYFSQNLRLVTFLSEMGIITISLFSFI